VTLLVIACSSDSSGPSDSQPVADADTSGDPATGDTGPDGSPDAVDASPDTADADASAGDGGSGADQGNGEGWFETGQSASHLLGAVGFDKSGGSLLFNHPKGIATDGTALLLADGNNNRVLVWRELPSENEAPDLVLGQPDFASNDSGDGPDEMSWPVGVAAGGGRFVVADTYNHRLLIYNGLPTTNGAEPDLVIDGVRSGDAFPLSPRRDRFVWPWGVWTDGTRLIVSSTATGSSDGGIGFGGWVLIWNDFPSDSETPADILLTADGNFGTPRSITTDGTSYLLVGDHNASGTAIQTGSWLWTTFPTSDASPDGFLVDPDRPFIWLAGDSNEAGQLLMIGGGLHLWNGIPSSDSTAPDVTLNGGAWSLRGGDGSGVALAGDRAFVSDYNMNRVVVFDELPTRSLDAPDFALGALDLQTDTFGENHFITNGVPASNGEVLLVGDGYDKRLYCWTDPSTAQADSPTAVFDFEDGVTDIAVFGDSAVAVGPMRGLRIWEDGLPCDGSGPDHLLSGSIGSFTVDRPNSVALDEHYFYLLQDGRLYVWNELPTSDQSPAFSLDLGTQGRSLYSDGTHLSVSDGRSFRVYEVATLGADAEAQSIPPGDWSSILGQGIVHDGHAFLVDRGFNRVYVWERVEDALAGEPAEVLLGASGWDDTDPGVRQDALFWPDRIAWDGRRLWVGEFKFSGRVVAFEVD
jgi:hypothetical protein